MERRPSQEMPPVRVARITAGPLVDDWHDDISSGKVVIHRRVGRVLSAVVMLTDLLAELDSRVACGVPLDNVADEARIDVRGISEVSPRNICWKQGVTVIGMIPPECTSGDTTRREGICRQWLACRAVEVLNTYDERSRPLRRWTRQCTDCSGLHGHVPTA